MRVVGYVRMSTEHQEDSVETQQSNIQAECRKRGLELVRFYVDPAVSATIPIQERPQGKELFADVRKKRRDFDAIMVLRMDRMFRDPEDEYPGIAYISRHGCELLSINDPIDRSTTMGKFIHGVMMHVRALERGMIGDRVKEHNWGRGMMGKFPGAGLPMGLKTIPKTGKVVATDRAPDALKAFECFVQANGNAREAARMMNAMGIPSPRGTLWEGKTVRRMVKSPAYRQEFRYGGKTFDAKDHIPQIVPPDLLQQTYALLDATKDMTPRQMGGHKLYAGMLHCSLCGSFMTSKGETREKENEGWVCRGARSATRTCDGRQVSQQYVDRLVVMALRDLMQRHLKELNAPEAPKKSAAKDAGLYKRLTDSRERVVDAWVSGIITTENRDRRLEEIDAQLREASSVNAPKPLAGITAEEIGSWIEVLDEEHWLQVPSEDRRRLLLAINAQMTLNTERRPLWIRFQSLLSEEPIEKRLPNGYPRLKGVRGRY